MSLVLGFFIAVPLAVTRVYGRFSAWLSLAYTELLRGTPLLAQLFVLYYGLNLASYVPGSVSGVFARDVVWVAILGFTLNGAAYQAEYIRGGALERRGGADHRRPCDRAVEGGDDILRRAPAGTPVRDPIVDQRVRLPDQVLVACGLHHGPRAVLPGRPDRFRDVPLHAHLRCDWTDVPRVGSHRLEADGARRGEGGNSGLGTESQE